MQRWNGAARAALIATAFALGGMLWLTLWPDYYRAEFSLAPAAAQDSSTTASAGASAGQTVHISRSLIDEHGAKVVLLLLFPVALAALGLLAVWWRDVGGSRIILWCNAVALALFCVVTLFSIGVFFLPAGTALVTSAAIHQRASQTALPAKGRRAKR
ncbi:MAG: hypothetical protein EXR48_00730 [Dehalococcoidia bacterium]|nr:hypothetical protein [Dehalococcoidia bacterium]